MPALHSKTRSVLYEPSRLKLALYLIRRQVGQVELNQDKPIEVADGLNLLALAVW